MRGFVIISFYSLVVYLVNLPGLYPFVRFGVIIFQPSSGFADPMR